MVSTDPAAVMATAGTSGSVSNELGRRDPEQPGRQGGHPPLARAVSAARSRAVRSSTAPRWSSGAPEHHRHPGVVQGRGHDTGRGPDQQRETEPPALRDAEGVVGHDRQAGTGQVEADLVRYDGQPGPQRQPVVAGPARRALAAQAEGQADRCREQVADRQPGDVPPGQVA